MADNVETNNMTELLCLLVKHGFDFEVNAVNTAMYHEGHNITAKVSLIEYVGQQKRELSSVFWVPGLDCLHDPNDEGGTADMDAQEVCIWWLNKFKDIQIKYGEA